MASTASVLLLPVELRVKIYQHYFGPEPSIRIRLAERIKDEEGGGWVLPDPATYTCKTSVSLLILRINKQIHKECSTIMNSLPWTLHLDHVTIEQATHTLSILNTRFPGKSYPVVKSLHLRVAEYVPGEEYYRFGPTFYGSYAIINEPSLIHAVPLEKFPALRKLHLEFDPVNFWGGRFMGYPFYVDKPTIKEHVMTVLTERVRLTPNVFVDHGGWRMREVDITCRLTVWSAQVRPTEVNCHCCNTSLRCRMNDLFESNWEELGVEYMLHEVHECPGYACFVRFRADQEDDVI